MGSQLNQLSTHTIDRKTIDPTLYQTKVAELIPRVRAGLWASGYNHRSLLGDSLSTAILEEDLALVTKQAISLHLCLKIHT